MPTPTFGYTVDVNIHEGQAEAFEDAAATIAKEVEKTEPGTVIYQWFLSPDKTSARICEWFTDQEAALAHLTGPTLAKHLANLLATADLEIEVYGTPGEKLAQTLADFPVSATYRELSGFTR